MDGIPKKPVLELHELRPTVSALPSLLGLPQRVLVQSGRAALAIALRCAGVRPGDSVLVPSYHCPTMVSPVEYIGARPVFYPTLENRTPDIEFIARLQGEAPRALVVPHLFGLPVALSTVVQFCASRDLVLIEDCAHCLFGRVGDRAVGTYGDFAIGSLSKFLPVVDGGLVASINRPLNQRLVRPCTPGEQVRSAWNIIQTSANAGRLGAIGTIVRGIQAARSRRGNLASEPAPSREEPTAGQVRLGSLSDPLLSPVALPWAAEFVASHMDFNAMAARRRENFRLLSQMLANLPGVQLPAADCGDDTAPYVVPLYVTDRAEAAYHSMRMSGLPVMRWDRRWPGSETVATEQTATWHTNLIQIACHQSISTDQLQLMAERIRTALNA